jgi:hypothetical protein
VEHGVDSTTRYRNKDRSNIGRPESHRRNVGRSTIDSRKASNRARAESGRMGGKVGRKGARGKRQLRRESAREHRSVSLVTNDFADVAPYAQHDGAFEPEDANHNPILPSTSLRSESDNDWHGIMNASRTIGNISDLNTRDLHSVGGWYNSPASASTQMTMPSNESVSGMHMDGTDDYDVSRHRDDTFNYDNIQGVLPLDELGQWQRDQIMHGQEPSMIGTEYAAESELFTGATVWAEEKNAEQDYDHLYGARPT